MPKTLATATVDRLLRDAHIVLTEGTSLRLGRSHRRQGSDPLDLDQQEISWPQTGR